MSYFVKEPSKNTPNPPPANVKWTLEMKILGILFTFILYIMLLMSAKMIYEKQQHLDKLDELVLKAEEKMHNLHTIDRSLAVKLERIENVVYDEDYDVTTEY